MRAEIRAVRRSKDGPIGIGRLFDETKAVLGSTRVTIRIDEETFDRCLDAIAKGSARTEQFEAGRIVEIALGDGVTPNPPT